MKQTLVQSIARRIDALTRCPEHAAGHHYLALDAIARLLPSGSGFDNGTQIDTDKSTGSRIVLKTAFHHMDDNGSYCGWSSHTVILTPCFSGFDVRVTGYHVRGIKDYIADVFDTAMLELTEL